MQHGISSTQQEEEEIKEEEKVKRGLRDCQVYT